MARNARVVIDRKSVIAAIDPRMYGSFIEHLGRAVYQGIYQPDHPAADKNGFRKDVLDLVRELQVPIIRYPGGNFVSNFFWEDSVGPNRQPRLDLAWRTIEPNTFGIDEFRQWTELAGSEVMMSVNLGTRGIADALNLLEYCNLDTDTKYARMRRANGHEKPYGIRTWCMGNEMDGPWQIGQKDAREYGKLAGQTAKAMKMMDDSIECVLCGSSNLEMPTFPEWERISLEEAYDSVDYVSLHQYYGNQAHDTEDFLAKTLDLDRFIGSVISVIDSVKARKRSKKQIDLSFDEWNVWYHSIEKDNEKMAREPWDLHPHLLEDHYTFEDALLVGGMLITFLHHADRIRIACLAQLVNVIAPIMTEEDGPAWRQTIFYPFCQVSRLGRGISLHCSISCDVHETKTHGAVPDIDMAAVLNEEKKEVVLFAVNRILHQTVNVTADLRSFGRNSTLSACTQMAGFAADAVNGPGNEIVKPAPAAHVCLENGMLTAQLPPMSWSVYRVKIMPPE